MAYTVIIAIVVLIFVAKKYFVKTVILITFEKISAK